MSSNTRQHWDKPQARLSGADAAALKLYDINRGRKEKSLFSDMLFAEIVSDNL
jgi:hypothetical protein